MSAENTETISEVLNTSKKRLVKQIALSDRCWYTHRLIGSIQRGFSFDVLKIKEMEFKILL